MENFIRLATLLDYALMHPHVLIHTAGLTGMTIGLCFFEVFERRKSLKSNANFTAHSCCNAEVLQLYGIDPSRTVQGPISARILHIPDGTPCGEPYAVSQVSRR